MPEGETWVFEDCEALVKKLKRRDWRHDFKRAHEEGPDLGVLSAVYRSVGSSTFRAFRRYKEWSPSFVFRECVARELERGKFQEFAGIRSKHQYRGWAVKFARDIRKEWRTRLRCDLEIPRVLKLINLLAKGLCIVAPLWPRKFEAIVWSVDVPLDKYSLRPLACISKLSSLGINWGSATMGSVEDLATYARIQKSIDEFCRKANVPPLAYDFSRGMCPTAGGNQSPGRNGR